MGVILAAEPLSSAYILSGQELSLEAVKAVRTSALPPDDENVAAETAEVTAVTDAEPEPEPEPKPKTKTRRRSRRRPAKEA